MAINPVARGLLLSDFHVGYGDGKVDLYGIFNSITPPQAYPYTMDRFCVFAQLSNGLGPIRFVVDIRYAPSDKLVWTTNVHELYFDDRHSIVQLALTIEKCRFEQPGIYILELVCENTWVTDTTLWLR